VCKQEVQNLPVILFRVQNAQARNLQGSRARQRQVSPHRVWQDVPVLVIVSMLAYFCFLEQLLVSNMGSGAIAISLPFSCLLGLLASMTSTTLVRRKLAWLYAAMQFTMVVLFAHLFYSLLNMRPVVAVLLATLAGFGGSMCGASILIELLKLRGRWHSQLNQHSSSQQVTQPHQPPETSNIQQSTPPPENETGVPRI